MPARRPAVPIPVDTLSLSPLAALVALQFLLHALSWALGAWMLREQRAVLGHWSAFLAFIGLGFLLMTQRDEQRSWLAFNGAALCWAGGLLMLWRGVERQFEAPPRTRLQAGLFGVLLVLHLLAGPGVERAVERVVLSYLGNAAIVAGLVASMYRVLLRRYGLWRSMALALPGVIVLTVFVALAVRQLLDPSKPLELHRFESSTVRSMYAYLVAAAIFNFGFMAVVVGQLTGRLRWQGERDALTGLYNRRALRERLLQHWGSWVRQHQVFTVLALDLDHFKRINDTHGHPVGDQVLEHVARVLGEHVRAHDTVGRMGGEEFVVLLPHAGLDQARALAQRLGGRLRDAPLVAGGAVLVVTASIALAEVDADDADVDALLRRADRALYRAKALGRDRVHEDRPGQEDQETPTGEQA